MLSLKAMTPAMDERAIILGQTGTGKSTLAAQLLNRTGRLAILDPKRMFKYPVAVYDRISRILRDKPTRFIYRPHEDEFGDIECMNAFFKYCYDLGNITVYIDDVVGVIENQKVPHYLRLCYQMGRARHIRMIASMQRAVGGPLVMFTEASRAYVFRLSEKLDVARAKSVCRGYDQLWLLDQEDPYIFAYYDQNKMRRCEYTKISAASLGKG